MPFRIIKADITTLAVDAIVNPTDPVYSGSGGTDLAVHRSAGPRLRSECDALPMMHTGMVRVTDSYDLPGRYIIHTVGPVWIDGGFNEPVLLRSCYINALLCAKKLAVSSVAFPLISSGTFGFPKDQVLEIAISAIRDFQETTDGELDITLCVHDRTAYELSRKYDLEEFLAQAMRKETYIHEDTAGFAVCCAPMPLAKACVSSEKEKPESLENWLQKQDDTFAVTLLKLIDKKGMTDVQCYKKAQVTKGTFWKINNDKNYHPGRQTALAFAIALELTLEETEQFLKTVGYTLSHSNTFDMIIEYYISNGIYDLYEINAALYRYDQPLIGC